MVFNISNKINESIQLLKKADLEHCQKYNRSSGLKQQDWDYIHSILKRQAEGKKLTNC